MHPVDGLFYGEKVVDVERQLRDTLCCHGLHGMIKIVCDQCFGGEAVS